MKNKLRTITDSFIFLMISCFTLLSFQVKGQQDSSLLMDEVVITATKSLTRNKDLPYAIVSLTKAASNNRLSRTLPESLIGLPGVYIQKTNHGGGSPFVRGLTGNQTLLMVDGIRLNNSIFRYGPNQYLTLIDNLIVDKVEVVKGTGSVQFGSDALSGVINVITKSPSFTDKNKWSGKLTSRFTGFGMEKTVRPELSFSSRKFAFSAGVSNKKFGDLRGGDTTGFQLPSGYKELSWDAKAKWLIGKDWNLTASYQQLNQSDVPVYHKYILENFAINNSDPLRREFGNVSLKKSFTNTFLKDISAYIAYQNIAEHRNSRKNGSNLLRIEDDRAATFSGGIDIRTKQSNVWTANTGFEFNADRIFSKRVDKDIISNVGVYKRGLYPDGSVYNNAALYSLHHFQIKRFLIEAGGRYNSYSIGISDNTLGKVKMNPSALVFQTGISFKLSNLFTLYSNISSGYRAPNIDDMGTLGIVDFRYEIPAYDLQPEKSINYEAGLKWSSKKSSGVISVFNTSLSNLITRIKTGATITGYDIYTKINVDKGFIQGYEIQTAYNPTKNFNINVCLTSLYGQSVTRNEPLRRIPPLNGQLGFQYLKGIYHVGFIGDFASAQRRLAQGDKDDNRIKKGGTPGYNVFNIYSGVDLKFITLKMYLNNILNEDYRTHGSGINGMGRSISLTAVLNLGS